MRLAWLSLPLGAASASLALMAAAPRYAVSHYCGPKALGGFAVAGGLMVAASLAIGSMSEAAVPRLANHFAARRPEFVRILGRMLALVAASGVVLVVAMAIFGRAIITLLYGAEFAHDSHLATGLMAAAVLKDLTVALGRGLSAMRRFRAVMLLRISTIFLLIVALLLLVPRFGLAGAVSAMIFAGLCGAITSGGVAWTAIRALRTAFPELPMDGLPKNR
jgi:O-antigen/teichoic acid export membrane protein